VPLELFAGPEIATLLGAARRAFGADAVAVATRTHLGTDGSRGFELLAADVEEARALHHTATAVAAAPDIAPVPPLPTTGRRRPYVVVLVGPTGAGKTTTIAKLATHPRVFGARGVGFLALDTYRIGAVEQLRTYAEIADIPCEVVYESKDLGPALARLARCRVVLVDTPGRGPRRTVEGDLLQHWVDRIHPDEVHLVLPAGLHPELARRHAERAVATSATHLLATKLDEALDDTSVFDIAAATGLPMRWYTDGQDVPADLRPARGPLVLAKTIASARTPSPAVDAPDPAAPAPSNQRASRETPLPAWALPAPVSADPLATSLQRLEGTLNGEVRVLAALRSALQRVESLT
jgi:flagellar biosynthesis protein FlhF